MTRCLLEFRSGVRSVSKDSRLKVCYVDRLNKHTNKVRKIKLYYIEFECTRELDRFARDNNLELVLNIQQLNVDAEYFDMIATASKMKNSRRLAEVV